MSTVSEPAATNRGRRQEKIGVVVSSKMDKTVVVEVERTTRHPIYAKVLRRSTRFKAHDEQNQCHMGDKVLLIETRPLSREKRWRVKEVLERAA